MPQPPAGPWLTVLMPAYNEAAGLEDAVGQVLAKLTELGIDSELLIVNDASRDGTAAIADALAEAHPGSQSGGAANQGQPSPAVRVVHHAVNQGIGGGFRSGVAAAQGLWMILIPADLALDLDELVRYFDAAKGADIVVGVSPLRSDYTRFRRLVSRANIWIIRTLFGLPLRQFNYISMYKVDWLRRISIEYTTSAFFFAEVLIKCRDAGAKLVEVDTTYLPRATGEATGAKGSLIRSTARDMLSFWLRWIASGKAESAKYRMPEP